jgi:type II secretory pathway component GspD/PulD (secretin)
MFWRTIALFPIGLFAIAVVTISDSRPLAGQEIDITRLAHPEVAAQLSLDDQQRAAIQQAILERAEALAAASDEAARTQLKAQFDQRVLGLLTEQQLALAKEAPTTQKLMFQFREMKWDNVLNWFAAQQDLTLVMDRTPPGEFTYSDVRSYTANEGIDLLNSVLITRGYTLVRREKMLIVMELSSSLPIELIPEVKLEQLDQRGKFELVRVTFPLAGRPMDAVLTEVQPYLSSYGRAVPLAARSQLLVVETAGKMRTINELIASVPLPKQPPQPEKPAPPPKPVFASYPLGTLNPEQALATIQKLIPSEQITVNSQTGVLSAFVIPDQQTAIKSAIDQMIASTSELPANETVAYRFSGIDPEELKKQILEIAPQATVSVTTDRALVIAPQATQQLIREAMTALQIEPTDSVRGVEVLSVSPSTTEAVGLALRSFLPASQVVTNATAGKIVVRGSDADRKLASEIVGLWKQFQDTSPMQLQAFPLSRTADATWLANVKQLIPNANAWLADGGEQLMVLGTPEEVTKLSGLVDQLLTILPEPQDRDLQIYVLTKNQQARRSSLADLPSNLVGLKIVDGTASGELLVWGSAKQHQEFAKLLEQIDVPTINPAPQVPKVYDLQAADTATVLQLLTAEFPQAKFTLDTSGKSLTVVADADAQSRIEERLTVFNAELPARSDRKLQPYAVPGTTAVALQQSLTPFLGTAQVAIDSTQNRLLIWADDATHENLAEIVDLLAAQPDIAAQKVVVAYDIAHGASATQMKTILDQVVRDGLIVADDKLQRVVVTGTLETQALIKSTIAQIDQPHASLQPNEIRSYDAKKLQPTILIPMLQNMWPNMQLSADTTAGRIIASGNPKDHESLRATLDRIVNTENETPHEVKTYPVPSGEMSTLGTILTQIAPQALISSDLVSRTVTVWGTAEQQTRIAQAIEQVVKTAQTTKVPAAYFVKPTQTLAVQSAILSLFPGTGMAIDSTTGQLIVVATSESQQRIAEVIKMLASGGSGDEQSIKVFRIDPQRVELTTMMSALQATVGPEVRLESNVTSNTIMAVGSSAELENVAQQVEQLLQQIPAPDQPVSKVYPLVNSNTYTALTILTPLVPRATLSHDPTTRTLAATASAQDHAKIEQFLKALDGAGIEKVPAAYFVKPTQVSAVQTSLLTLFPMASVTVDVTSGQVIVVAAAEVQEKVNAVVELMAKGGAGDERTIQVFRMDREKVELTSLLTMLQSTVSPQVRLEANLPSYSIMAIGSSDELKQVADRIALLEQQLPAPDKKISAVYPLKHATTPAAITILTTLVPRATLAQDPVARTIAATATAAEQQQIQEFLTAFDIPKQSENETRVYRMKNESARGISFLLSEAIPEARIYGSRESGALIATATPEQHERIEAIVKEYDQGEGTKKKTVFYPLTTATPDSLARALTVSYPQSVFSADTVGGGLFVTANDEEHTEIAQLIKDMDSEAPRASKMKTFVLKHAEPVVVASALRDVFGRQSGVGVSSSEEAQAVFVVAADREMAIVEKFIQELDQPLSESKDRMLKMFSVKGTEGDTVTEAVESLFVNSAIPVDVRYDFASEQLFVVGSASQLEQVERTLAQLSPPERELHVIRLQTVDPFAFRSAVTALFEDEPSATTPVITIDESQQRVLLRATSEQFEQIKGLLRQLGEATLVSVPGDEPREVGGAPSSDNLAGRLRQIPIHRNSERLLQEVRRLWPTVSNHPLRVIVANGAEEGSTDEASQQGTKANEDDQAIIQTFAPIVVIPGEGQWTIASEDPVAIERLQRLVEALINPRLAPFASSGNYSVYLLRHAGAEDIQELLVELFDSGSGRGFRSSFGDVFRRLKFVADPRINAIIFSGNPGDRKVVEELLGVLDSEDLVDTLQEIRPIVIPLQSANAENIEDIVQDIYRSQMSSGAGRRPLRIPEGLSSEVAVALQQINAQVAGPLLTLARDETTNSILVRAPQELAEEVKTFIESLDKRASETPSRRVKVIQLESTNAENLQRALRILLSR